MAGLLESLYSWRGGLVGRADAARESILDRVRQEREGARQARAGEDLVQAYGPQLRQMGTGDAGIIGSLLQSPSPEARATGQQMAGMIAQRRAAPQERLTAYQAEQVSNWQRQAAMEAQSLQMREQEMALRQQELMASRGFREQTVAQAWERLGQQYRPTPQQGSVLANAEWAVNQIDSLISAARPEFFGFVSDNVGDAVLEYRNRFGTDEDFSTYWNLLDNLRIEINSGRMAGILSDQDIRLLNEIWPRRSNSDTVAYNRLGTLREIMQGKRDVSLQAISNSGRALPQGPARPAPAPPPGFRPLP